MRILLPLVLLLGLAGCSSSTEPEAMPTSSVEAEPQASETMDPMDPMDPMESEPAETSDETETASPSPTASPTQSPTQSATQSPTQTASASPSPTQTSPALTLAEVAKRNTQSDCWVAIDGNVYDLTRWISSHPGGPGAIRNLCGTDGTAEFIARHGGQGTPTATLSSYLIGPLVR
jgi:cytochrome b involved in lipid metabolism